MIIDGKKCATTGLKKPQTQYRELGNKGHVQQQNHFGHRIIMTLTF